MPVPYSGVMLSAPIIPSTSCAKRKPSRLIAVGSQSGGSATAAVPSTSDTPSTLSPTPAATALAAAIQVLRTLWSLLHSEQMTFMPQSFRNW
jgi:hypothetical protein